VEKNGFVISVVGDIAHVSVIRPSECGDKCSSCSGSCNVQSMVVQVSNTLSAHVGDRVELSMQSAQLVKLSFLLYTVPLLCFVLGVFIGYAQAEANGLSGDFIGLGAGFLSMILSYIGVNTIMKRMTKASDSILTMVRCYQQGDVISS